MLGIVYYWTVCMNYDMFDNVTVHVATDMDSHLKNVKQIEEMNDEFSKISEIKTGEKHQIGNHIIFENFNDTIKFTNAYFLVTYKQYYCNLELYTITDEKVDVPNLMEYLSTITINNLSQPYKGGFLAEDFKFMNNDYYCLYNTEYIKYG
jgi:hypothetical protein